MRIMNANNKITNRDIIIIFMIIMIINIYNKIIYWFNIIRYMV